MVRRYRVDILIGAGVFAVCLIVYNATLTPSLSYESPDGNELATICYTLGLAHSTGYPLYTWLGKLFTFLPVGDVAHRVNLMSAVLGAGGVVVLYATVRHLTSVPLGGTRRTASRLASAFCALLFGFSLTFWSQTGIAEVYAPNVFMLELTLVLLLAWSRVEERDRAARPSDLVWWRSFLPSLKSLLLLAAFALCFGLSMGTHMSNLGFAAGFALFMLLVSWRTSLSPVGVGIAGAGFVLGLLQFLWLPFKAASLTDRAMLANAPTTLKAMYSYTLGAFPQFRFAFSLPELPDRIVIYLLFLRQQFGLLGIGLGLLGMFALLARKPKRFFLIVTMYLVHVWFFIQYNVFDLDVFFIPAHLLYAVFIGCGLYWLIERLLALVAGRPWWRRALCAALAASLALPILVQIGSNWESNDYSDDTAINDFYGNVFELLPEGAAVLGNSGVFGYDMFYHRLVYDARPDVLMPHLSRPDPDVDDLAGRELFTTVRLDTGRAVRGPWALPRDLIDDDAWYVPVLAGSAGDSAAGRFSRPLVLYYVSDEPPQLIVDQASPENAVGQEVAGWTLVGYDLADDEVSAGGALHLTLYWRAGGDARQVVFSTSLGDVRLETHEPGMGNLQRYLQLWPDARDGVLIEDWSVVVPSGSEPGSRSLTVGVTSAYLFSQGVAEPEELLQLGEITILSGE